ncbi:MAG: glycoside hydrolase family 32 protein [Planctomycetia bacterium]|nr:glycoside hydrolase family 32 protein [Planctomycetia bacterium]
MKPASKTWIQTWILSYLWFFASFSVLSAFCPALLLAEGEIQPKALLVDGDFLIFPIRDDGEKTRLEILSEGSRVHYVDIAPAHSIDETDWWASFDVREFRDEKIQIRFDSLPEGSELLSLVRVTNTVPRREKLYDEKFRPQLRFSQIQGWNNDPNGLVWLNGEFHLFWQSNPVGRHWGNMYWGHAVSKDLIHWDEIGLALRPHGEEIPASERPKCMAVGKCFSGSAHVVPQMEGEAQSSNPILVACFTDTSRGEALAWSADAGRSWTYAEFNPIIAHRGRDPKLVWYEEGACWIIAVYDEGRDGKARNIDFYRSVDLKKWEKTGTVEGFYECPELFALPVRGESHVDKKWVLFAADGQYQIGIFDGKTFRPEHEGKFRVHYGKFYAAQCFNNHPQDRVIQLGWAQIPIPNEQNQPFNQGFTLPIELTLRETPEGTRLFAEPIRELETLRENKVVVPTDGVVSLENFGDGQLYEIRFRFRPADAPNFRVRFGSSELSYDAAAQKLSGIPASPDAEGWVCAQVFVDRPMYEVSVNRGAAYFTGVRSDAGERFDSIRFENAWGVQAEVWSLRSIHAKRAEWEK